MGKLKDITGCRFGRLVVVEITNEVKYSIKSRVWKCKCDCGNEVFLPEVNFKHKGSQTKSCGCLRSGVAREMAKSRTEEQQSASGKILNKFMLENDCKEGTSLSSLKRKTPKTNKSGTKGVYLMKKTNKWKASIGFKGELLYLGCFTNKQDAINARKEAEEKYFKPMLEKYGKIEVKDGE